MASGMWGMGLSAGSPGSTGAASASGLPLGLAVRLVGRSFSSPPEMSYFA